MAVVFWFEPDGKVLHTSAGCQQLLRALAATGKATAGLRPKLRSCDMEASITGNDDPYPPDDLEPCPVCSRPRRSRR